MTTSSTPQRLGWVLIAVTCLGGSRSVAELDRSIVLDLLALPAPDPVLPNDVVPSQPPREPDSAVLADQVSFLHYWSSFRFGEAPPDPPRQQILEVALEHPRWIEGVLPVLPTDIESRRRVEAAATVAQGEIWHSDRWEKAVEKWLASHDSDRADDVAAVSKEVKDEDGWVRGREDLEALVRLAPATAIDVLEELAVTGGPRTSALAMSLRYELFTRGGESARAEELRRELKALVESPDAVGFARNRAAEALLSTDWAGRDEWYEKLFADGSLLNLRDGHMIFSPLSQPLRTDPDTWIPQVATLVGNPDRHVHDQAVDLLVSFHLERARVDALRPLLPWLAEPAWSSASDRLRLVQSLDRVGLREAIPRLIGMIERRDELADWAADALGGFRASEAVPALKALLPQERDSMSRRRVAEAILACGGFSPDEVFEALVRWAEQMASEEGRQEWFDVAISFGEREPLDLRLTIADVVLRTENFQPEDRTVQRVVEGMDTLEASDPAAASVLRTIVATWSDERIDRMLVGALRAGRASARTVEQLIFRRAEFRRHAEAELRSLLADSGIVRGLAAVLLGDGRAMARLLDEGDEGATAALLAGARIAGEALPLPRVGKMLASKSDLVSRAAEAYLEAEGSAAARGILYGHWRNEAKIIGLRASSDPGHESYPVFDEVERQLREEVLRRSGPDEVLALLAAGYFGSPDHRIIRMKGRGASFSCGSAPAATIDASQIRPLLDFLRDRRIEELPRLENASVADGIQYEFLRLNRGGGLRLFMNNPDLVPGSTYAVLVELFRELGCPE